MGADLKTERWRVAGMTCPACQRKIEKKLCAAPGVASARADYAGGTVDVSYNPAVVSPKEISALIEGLDYQVLSGTAGREGAAGRTVGLLLVIVALFMLAQHFGVLTLLSPDRLAEANMGLGMLFVLGLVTSAHCMAMCGGLNLSQSLPRKDAAAPEPSGASSAAPAGKFIPPALYNLGRVISYTAVGFLVGALGSVFSFSLSLQGALKLAAGVFMVIMGLNMLGLFPALRRLQPRLPRALTRVVGRASAGARRPLVVGLLGGLMPCGPLQAMQLYALSTGSPFTGALSMFLFALGTVPLMFGLGALSAALGARFAKKVIPVGAVLVAVMGLAMFSQGWTLAGWQWPSLSLPAPAGTQQDSPGTVENGVQLVRSTLARGYPNITVQAGLPVRWVIDAPAGSVNRCNNRLFFREYGLDITLEVGENLIEFTPTAPGTYRYNCWMGMISGTVTVT
ncbi:MAG: sulfite exporter TauE/SafE family protein [Oscillospiraceae bacterium]|jgi:sulfite exporter TauE/SafE/copper chaperone CopZ|nr:sulfite exporter TauE/SafE family protein [Oscillospiraceae bacterium]